MMTLSLSLLYNWGLGLFCYSYIFKLTGYLLLLFYILCVYFVLPVILLHICGDILLLIFNHFVSLCACFLPLCDCYISWRLSEVDV